MSVTHDLLLEWVSEKASGTWDEFKNTWDWLASRDQDRRADDPAGKGWIQATNLAALGHTEITWGRDSRWAVAPPVITMLPNSGGRALLTGARTRALYRPGVDGASRSGVLAESADELDVWIDDLPRNDGPASVVISVNRAGDARRLAEACGVSFSYSVSDQISAMLPPLAAYTSLWTLGTLPEGFPVERFNTDTVRWDPLTTDHPTHPGLYRCRTWQEHVHVLIDAIGQTIRVSKEHAVYETLRWDERPVLDYEPFSQELWVAVNARLPLMQERAAVLCSGQLPRYRRRNGLAGIAYWNVQTDVAERIAESLCQPLRTDG